MTGDRARVRRNARRAEYDRDTLYAVLDAEQICHVSYVVDGEPRMIPTLYFREGDSVYLHGNRQAALLRHLSAGGLCCIGVTAVHGVVVARSGFHCSMNYASVTLFGHGEAVTGSEHRRILDRFVDALVPGHGAAVREPTEQELAATAAVRVPIEEAAAKIRSGPPVDDEADLVGDTWAGEIPIRREVLAPVPDPTLKPGIELPDYIRDFGRSGHQHG